MARGRLGRAIGARYPPTICRTGPQRTWGPAGRAIPGQLSTDPAPWPTIQLPSELAACLDVDTIDLARPGQRRAVLPLLLDIGPAELIAATLTLPQLADEWPHLPLDPLVRRAWETSYPTLTDDTDWDAEAAPTVSPGDTDRDVTYATAKAFTGSSETGARPVGMSARRPCRLP